MKYLAKLFLSFAIFCILIMCISSCNWQKNNDKPQLIHLSENTAINQYKLETPSGQLFSLTFDSIGNLYTFRNVRKDPQQLIVFNKNGNIATIAKQIEGYTNHGRTYHFFEGSGNLEIDYNYINGVKEGVAWKYYDTIGMLKETLLFNDFGECYYKILWDKEGNIYKREGELYSDSSAIE